VSKALSTHWEIFTAILGQRWLKWIGGAWVLLGTYDLVLSQFAPEDLAKKFPKAYEVIAMTYGWLPWWAWGWTGTAIFAIAAIEYAVRLHSRAAVGWSPKRSGLEINTDDKTWYLLSMDPKYQILCVNVKNHNKTSATDCQIGIFGGKLDCMASKKFDLRIGESRRIPLLYLDFKNQESVPSVWCHNRDGDETDIHQIVYVGEYILTVYSKDTQPQSLTVRVSKPDEAWHLESVGL